MSTVLFWQLFCLALLAALFVSFWLVYRLELRNQIKRGELVDYRTDEIVDSVKRHKELVDCSPGEQKGHIRRYADHGLHGSNRDRSKSAFHDWH